MACARILPILGNGIRFPRDLWFLRLCAARQLFDHAAIAVTGSKIHMSVNIGGVVAQDAFHYGGLFEKLPPVLCGEQAQTEDAIDDHIFMTDRRTTQLSG